MIDRLKGKTVFVDEFSMVNRKWWRVLYYAFVKHNITVHIYGDINQIEAVKEAILDINAPFLRQMCPTVNHLQYIEASGRYTQKMYEILNKLLKTGKLDTSSFKPIDSSLKTNICYTNAMRRKITKQLCTEGIDVTFNYVVTKKSETYKIYKGMKMICTTNDLKDFNMYNSSMHTITAIDKGNVTLKYEFGGSHTVDMIQFSHHFIPAYCSTTHKYQGKTITEPYNIYEADKMSLNLLYTALSRCKHEDQIHIGTVNPFYPKIKPDTTIEERNLIDNGEWRHSKIYKVNFSDGRFYIGYTTQKLKDRLAQHMNLYSEKNQTTATRYYKDSGIKPTIELLHQYPCFKKEEIEGYEHRVIQMYKKQDPDNILNKQKMNEEAKEPKWKNETKVQVKRHIVDNRFKIHEDKIDRCYYIDTKVNGKRFKTKARYGNRSTKEEAYEKIQKKSCEFAVSFSMD
jgi:predicted GIY-YIG superfamily endonuclease